MIKANAHAEGGANRMTGTINARTESQDGPSVSSPATKVEASNRNTGSGVQPR